MAMFDRSLAAILVKHGVLAEEGSGEALVSAERERKSLTQYLIEQRVPESDIIGAVSMEVNLPPIDLGKFEYDPEAVALLGESVAKQYQVMPVSKIGDTLTLAVANPKDVMWRDNINLHTNCRLMPVVSTDVAIEKAIRKAYNGEEAQQEVSGEMRDLVNEMDMDMEGDLEIAADDDEDGDGSFDSAESESKPVVKLVNLTILEAVKAGTTSIHIEPYEKTTRVRFRVDGVCSERMAPPRRKHNALVSRIKIMASLDIAERRKPQDGKFKMKIQNRDIDFRVSILPTVHAEKVVMRVLDASGSSLSLESLGFEEKSYEDISKAVESANGMILATGPTGSGKTTTLYSAVKKIVCVEDNITTVEDPVEYTMEGVNQVQVNERRGLTFARVLRSILRQDPDTVLIGEIRDEETAEIALKAALTGHLVFSTLHTNDAPGTITRLVNMGVDSFLVASCVILVGAQRLVRRLCPACRKSYKPDEARMREWGFTEEEIAAEPSVYTAPGCSKCGSLGYKGQLALVETLPINEEVRELIAEGGSTAQIKVKAMEQGMLTLRRVGILNAVRGNASMEEVLSTTMPDR